MGKIFRINGKLGFTLAEVMIVLAIIGVVAVLVLPHFIQDMAERINSHRQANIAQKITKSVELMVVNGDYQGIYNTEQFVDKLSKYLKIAKRCNSANISECWPTRKIKTAKGEVYNVEDAKTGKDLHTKGNTDNVGLVLADGATLIMTFNPNASAPSAEGGFIPSKKALPVGNGKTEEFAYTSNATNAIDFVMDVNGATGPNQESDGESYYDIRSFKRAAFSKSPCSGGFLVGKVCFVDLGEDYEDIDCTKEENFEYCDPLTSNPSYVDYWAGANKACDEIGMKMVSKDEWESMARNKVFQENLAGTGYHFTSSIIVVPNGQGYTAQITSNNKSDVWMFWSRNEEKFKVLCISK